MKKHIIGIGMRIRTIGKYKGATGVVTAIERGMNITDHGFIIFKIQKNNNKKTFGYLNLGDEESFVFYKWWKNIEVII